MKTLFTIVLLMVAMCCMGQVVAPGGDLKYHTNGPFPVYYSKWDSATASNFHYMRFFTSGNYNSVSLFLDIETLDGGDISNVIFQVWGSKMPQPEKLITSNLPYIPGYTLIANDSVQGRYFHFNHDINSGQGNTYKWYMVTVQMPGGGAPYVRWKLSALLR